MPSEPRSPSDAAAPAAPANGPCDLLVRAVLEGGPESPVVVVSIHNTTGELVELTLPDRCPDGAIALTGLGTSYDIYGTCNAGACQADRPAIPVRIHPGATTEVARARIWPAGGTCNRPLAAGDYRISPLVSDDAYQPYNACSVPAVLTIADAPRLAPAAPPPPKPNPPARQLPPAPPAKASVDFHTCTADSDCVIFCPEVAGCCGWPCGCKNAINRSQKDAYEAHYRATCQRPRCPAVGCLREDAHFATCRGGRCVAASLGL